MWSYHRRTVKIIAPMVVSATLSAIARLALKTRIPRSRIVSITSPNKALTDPAE
ncbi:MAG: hypothetical protein KatS3mg115_0993 [Candidatus Poribacteria bacterium]|nr:MAG: hypothetical protein KatS3mg115_0993 [Candidatus Poribacteria bacterium]